jgi:pimeloyl-ACP methyl ester carboxylesterase
VTYQWLATRNDIARMPPPGVLVDIGRFRLHLWCTGEGTPSVILDTGLGGTTADWALVQPEVAKFTRVCSYDRAGMGYSDAGPSPQTARRNATELFELLSKTGISGPVVLTGASIGGFDIRVFASDHPDKVAGLVLVDASHESDVHEPPPIARYVPLLSTLGVLRLRGVSFGQPVEALPSSAQPFARATRFRTSAYKATADEIIHAAQSADEVRASRRRLEVPILAITGARGADASWRALQQDLASLSDRGCVIEASRSGHVVALDQPAVVVNAIRALVETSRGGEFPPCRSQ